MKTIACSRHLSRIQPALEARGSRFEIVIASRFLKTGAFDVQNVITIPTIKMIRMLGELTTDEMLEIETGLKVWLGLTD